MLFEAVIVPSPPFCAGFNVNVTSDPLGTIFPSAINADVASYIVLALATSALTLDFLWIDKKFGIAIAANIAMIAITIISSISVNPFFFCFVFLYSLVFLLKIICNLY